MKIHGNEIPAVVMSVAAIAISVANLLFLLFRHFFLP
jgi:hypothetical protein